MSRPASESLGTAKRNKTLSSCAESVERLYIPPTHHPLPPILPPPPQPPSQLPSHKHPRKRLRPSDHHHHTHNLHHHRRQDLYQQQPLPQQQHPSYPPHPMPSSHHHRPPQPDSIRPKRPRHIQIPSIPSVTSPPQYTLPTEDDHEGHLIYKLGEGLHPSPDFPHGRYKILSDLGEGTFGKVVECWDRRQAHRVAIKVVRSVTKYREAARLEIDVLLHLNLHDPQHYYHCVKLYSWFDYRHHVCMVFEKLGPSLYEQLRRNSFQPFPLDRVREYAFQLLESVNFVHSLTLIHTDLKPENILLVNANHPNEIKLIDFGSATFEKQHHSAVISTRHYRAPEVILGLGWTYPCDLWSIGCILVELYTGQALFQTHENLEHLAMMSHVLGPIPDSMIRRADGSGQKYFSRHPSGRRKLNWPGGASSKASIRTVRRIQSLKDIIRRSEAHPNFFDLVRRLLAFEPDTRCTSAEALKHPFFRETLHESEPPLTTPTPSSGSSACGSHIGKAKALRPRHKGSSRRRNPAQTRALARDNPANRPPAHRLDDEGDDTATEMPTVAEHSDHTLLAPISPRRPLGNAHVA